MRGKLLLLILSFGVLFGMSELSQNQKEAYDQIMLRHNDNVKIKIDEKKGVPKIISFDKSHAYDENSALSSKKFLDDFSGIFGVRLNEDYFQECRSTGDKKLNSIKYQQIYKGIPVFGGEIVVSMINGGEVKGALSSYYKDISLNTNPNITIEEAKLIALNNQPYEKNILDSLFVSELVVFPGDNDYYLAYRLEFTSNNCSGGWRYFINAKNGQIIDLTSDLQNAQANAYYTYPPEQYIWTANPLANAFDNWLLNGTYVNVTIYNNELARAIELDNDFRYSPNEYHFDEANIYYHVDKIARYFENSFGFQGYGTLLYPKRITVYAHTRLWTGEIDPNTGYPIRKHGCSYTGSTNKIYMDDAWNPYLDDYDPGYENYSYEDKVIYHEYTHSVVHKLADLEVSAETGALGEGLADYFPACKTGRVKILNWSHPSVQRDITNPVYSDYSEYTAAQNPTPHDGGTLISACLWDINKDVDIEFYITDIVYNSLSQITSTCDFEQFCAAMITCDSALYSGVYENYIKYWFNKRGIISETGSTTTQGTLTKDEIWYFTKTLTGDVYVPTGITLRITEGADINLGTYSITSTGGSIVFEGDESEIELSPDIRVMSGSTVEGIYSGFTAAFAAGNTIEVHNDFNLNGLTVPSGKTMKVMDDVTIRSYSGKSIGVSGTLIANNATFTNISGVWYGIKYNNGSLGYLNNCIITNSTYGVYLNGSSRDITNCTITTNSIPDYGIYCYNCDQNADITNNTITANYGIYCDNSSPDIKENRIISSMVGLYCVNSSSPLLVWQESGIDGDNYFHSNYTEFGVYATGNSYPIIGTASCGLEYFGDNSFVYQDLGISMVYNGSAGTIKAEHCWWGSSSPSAGWFSGNVDYTPWLTSIPTYSMPGLSPENNLYDTRMMLSSVIPGEEASEDLTKYYNDQWDMDKKIDFLRYLYIIGEAKGVANLCQDIIFKNPYASQSFSALDLIYQISRNEKIKKDFDEETLETYLKTLEDSRSDKFIKANAMLMLAGLEKDVARMDEVYTTNEDTYMGKFALHQKFMYYFNEVEDTALARAVLDIMDKEYPNEAVTYESHVLIGDKVMDPKEFYSQLYKQNPPEELQSMPTDISEVIPDAYALNAAYPNPFNPSTTIEFALPVQSNVACSIFDVSGSLIKEFSYEQNAGTYSIIWNASNVSSGIYLIRFVAEASDGSETFVDYQKVTLLK